MKRNDLSRSLIAFDQATTLVAVVELSLGSWLAAGLVPHLTRQPLKKLRSDPEALLGLVLRWRDQATKAGGRIKRIVVAFEAGRDGLASPLVAGSGNRKGEVFRCIACDHKGDADFIGARNISTKTLVALGRVLSPGQKMSVRQ